MFIKKLFLKNFRSYSEESIDFSNGINILTGANAQGKTNAAEAIFFLCIKFIFELGAYFIFKRRFYYL